MTTAAAAIETARNIGPDFHMLDAFDAEYMDVEAIEAANEEAERAERQRINARMAEWWS